MERKPDRTLDLQGTACPMNWVKARLELEEMAVGDCLEILVDDGDPVRGVTKSVRIEGHKVLEITPLEGAFRVLIERAGPEKPPTKRERQ